MGIKVITPPADLAVPLDLVKEHLRIEDEFSDAYIDFLVSSATAAAQDWTGRAFITQTLEQTFDSVQPYYNNIWPRSAGYLTSSYLELSRPVLQSVDFIDYYDVGGALVRAYDSGSPQVGSTDYFITDAGSLTNPGRIYPANGVTWPVLQVGNSSAITVRFVAGYGDSPDDVPAPIRHAILMLCGHFKANPDAVAMVGGFQGSAVEIPLGCQWLLGPYRVHLH